MTDSSSAAPPVGEAITAELLESIERLGATAPEAAGGDGREEALAAFRRQLGRLQSHVRDIFEQGRLAGLQAAELLARLMDGLVQALYAYVGRSLPSPEPYALLATGGYGRGVLAPFSDIDLLFITADEPSAATREAVAFMLYFLWDLGLKVGHATRSIAECLAHAEDVTVRTSLLDARFLAGDREIFAAFETAFGDFLAERVLEFIDAKREEREARHRRYGESAFLLEPNIKEGRGGLRDLQTLLWMARASLGIKRLADLAGIRGPLVHGQAGALLTENEVRLARRSWNFLWTVRFNLHYVAGRAEERLTFDLQPIVGARMGYTRHGRQDGVERFMRHYFLTAREVVRLTSVLEPALLRIAVGKPAIAPETDKSLIAEGFMLEDGKLICAPGSGFDEKPLQGLRILQVARDRGLELHPLALRGLIRNERLGIALRQDPRAAAIFLDLLCDRPAGTGRGGRAEGMRPDGARWLAILNQSGILGRYIPDWARIVGQMQFDTYHVYTVDEHTIEVIRVLNQLERGELAEVAPIASSMLGHIQSRRALYVAALLHDIGKGRGGDHSEIGAEIALELGPRLGLSAEETEMVSWLVLHHLLLSQTAFKRDIDDPKTILDLADTIQSPERLRLLLVLTVADMRAVAPTVWNGWKATLLRKIFSRVMEVLEGGLATTERDERVARAKAAVSALLADWPEEDREAFLARGYPSYWLSFDPETHERHARMIRVAEARGDKLVVLTDPLPARAVTEVTVYTEDHPGLFSQIAGALALAGASIVDARIHTMTDGMALDVFWVQDAKGGVFESPHRLARLATLIEQALSGRLRLKQEIPKLVQGLVGKRMRAIHVPPRVVIDNHASNTHTVIEINGRDRPGLLHDVTAVMSQAGLQIASAHITTYGMRAVDVFYVKDVFGLKVENEQKLARLREALLAAIEPGGAEHPAAERPPEPAPLRRRLPRASQA